MPLLLSAIAGALLQIAGSMVGRVLLALGFGYVTYKGVSALMGWTLDAVKTAIGGMSGDVTNLIGFLWVDKAITMVFSAYAAAQIVKGISGGAISKLKVK